MRTPLPEARLMAATGQQPPFRPKVPGVWWSSRQLGSNGAGLASLGQGTVAIMAGFDLTTVVLLTVGNSRGGVVQAAIACFGLSAALFILAMAFITAAEDYSATPDDRLMYYPEAKVSADDLEDQRVMQYQDTDIMAIYFNYRITPTVVFAVLGTLAGLVLTLVAKGWSPGPAVAAGAAIAVGLVYVADTLKGGRNWWLFPRPVLGQAGGETDRPAPAARRGLERLIPGPVFNGWQQSKQVRDGIVRWPSAPPMSPVGRQAMLGDAPGGHEGAAPDQEH